MIAQISLTGIPQYLEDRTAHKLGNPRLIRDLTGPLLQSLSITEEMYSLHFRIPVGPIGRAFHENILRTLEQNDKLWAKFTTALEMFARTETLNPHATTAEGLWVIEDVKWMPPIQRFFETLDLYSPRRFTQEVDEYLKETQALNTRITEWLDNPKC